MAPPGKHRELQPSGLGEWDGFADKDLRNALITGGLGSVPVIGTLLALISNYTNSTKSLPIALEFDASVDDDTRKALLKGKYNRHGELSGILQNLADQAYQEMGWTRAPVTRQWTPSTEWEANPRMAIISIPSDGSDPYLLRDNNGNLQTASHTEIEWGKSLSSWISNLRRYAGALEPDNYTKPDGIKANIANKNFPNIPPGQAKTWDPTFSGTQGTRVDPNIPSTISDLEGIAQADPSRRAAFEKEYAEKTRMFTSKPLLKDYLMKQRNLNPDEWEIDFSYDSEKSSSGTDMFFLKELNLIHKASGETVPFTGEALAEIQSGYLNYISVGQPTTDEFPTGTFPATGAWSVPGAPQTGAAGAIAGYGQPATGMADTPLGANLAAPGIPMPGSLQQQALSRVPLPEYRQALPAAMPGGDIPLMRGLYRTPLSLAQNAYSLATQMGAFSPANIPGGTGAHEFQQYLGMQPDWRGDLQRGLAAIETVKQKIISGISPSQLSDAEKAIYTSYIGGTEDNPYAGSERELALRQQLTQMLPMPLRQSAFQNLQNIYNQALATRPTTVGGMPQAFMYGGSGSPFKGMTPMQLPTSTPSVQNIPIGQSISMDTMGENTAVTGTGTTTTTASDGSTVEYKPNPEGTGTIATIVPSKAKSTAGTTVTGKGGTRRESWKDGSAMVKRAPDGSIMEVYLIEADGSKKVLQTGQGDPMKKWTDESAPSQPPPKVIPKPTPAPTPKPTGTPTPPPTWKAGQPLSEQYLAFLRQGGVSPTQVKELKETDMQTNDKSVPLVAPSNPLTPPKNITDKLKEIYDRDKMLQRFENYDYQVGKDLTWDPSNQDQFNLYMNQRVRQELGKAEQAKALANAQYMGAGGANLPPLTAPLPIPNTNLPYGYNNYIGFGGAKPPIIAANPAATAAAHAQWINQGKSNYNINKPTALDLANAFNYTMFPR